MKIAKYVPLILLASSTHYSHARTDITPFLNGSIKYTPAWVVRVVTACSDSLKFEFSRRGAWRDYYESPVSVAIKSGSLNKLKAIHDARCVLNYATEWGSYLHVVSKTEHADIAQYLVDNSSVDLNAKDSAGLTALQYAVLTNNYEIATILLKRGADPNIQSAVIKNLGDTSVRSLKVKRNDKGEVVNTGALTYNSIFHGDWDSGLTALHLATMQGSVDMCSLLLKYGADLTASHIRGLTPLHLAAMKASSTFDQKMIWLFEEVATDEQFKAKDIDGRTYTDIMQFLPEESGGNVVLDVTPYLEHLQVRSEDREILMRSVQYTPTTRPMTRVHLAAYKNGEWWPGH